MNDLKLNSIDINQGAEIQAQKQLNSKRELEAAQDFEAMFIQTSLKHMRPKSSDGLFKSGFAEDVFYQFLDEAIAKEISKSSSNFGIASQVIKQQL